MAEQRCICLLIFYDHIATYIDVAFRKRLKHFLRSDIILEGLIGVDGHFEYFNSTSKTYDIRYSRNRQEVTLYYPVTD